MADQLKVFCWYPVLIRGPELGRANRGIQEKQIDDPAWRPNLKAFYGGTDAPSLKATPFTASRQRNMPEPRANIRLLFLLLSLLVISLVSGDVEAAADQAIYTLGSGDRVRVTVFGEEDLSGDFDVGGSGVISMPLIGEVEAGGLTLRQLGKVISEKLLDGYLKNPRVSVAVLNYRPFYILGEVKEPGSYPYVSGMTVLNAVVLAGGYTPFARKKRLLIKRAKRSGPVEQRATEGTVVLPGDIIRVP